VSSLSNWDEFGDWAYSIFSPRIEITEEIQEKSRELTWENINDYQKIRSIYDYIRTEIDYIQADLNRGGFTPHFSNEILSYKYGDCKDQVTIFLALLHSVDIQAFPALITTYSSNDIENTIPSQIFNHMIVYIPFDGNDIWLDTTTDDVVFPRLYWGDQNKSAYIINNEGGHFLRTPASISEDNKGNFNLSYKMEDRLLTASIKFESNGGIEDNLRSYLEIYNKSEQKNFFRDLIESYYGDVEITGVEIDERSSTKQLYTQSIQFRYPESALLNNEILYNSSLPLAFLNFMIYLPEKQIRKYDYVFPIKYSISGSETLHSPWTDYSIYNLPQNTSLDTDHISFIQNFERISDIINVNWEFKLKNDVVKKNEFDSFLNDIEKIENSLLWEINLVEKKKYVASEMKKTAPSSKGQHSTIVSGMGVTYPKSVKTKSIDPLVSKNILEFIDESIVAFDNEDIDEYMESLSGEAPNYQNQRKTLKTLFNNFDFSSKIEDAKVIDILFDEALVDYTQITIISDEENSRTTHFRGIHILSKVANKWKFIYSSENSDYNFAQIYSSLGKIYLDRKEYNKAVEAYQIALANDSSYVGALGNIGWTYYLKGDYNKCIEYSEKAVTLDSTALYARYNIALSYLCLEEFEKSKEVYSETINYNQELGEEISSGVITDLENLIEQDFMKDQAQIILDELFHINNKIEGGAVKAH
jgi:tetratricopeptide (TPR) repeat protein